jgi:hypothetical protein
MKKRVYVDTSYILSFIFKDIEYEDTLSLFSSFKSEGSNFEFVLLQPSLGEAITIISKKYGQNKDSSIFYNRMQRLADMIIKYKINAENCMTPPPKCVFKLAHSIESEDKRQSYNEYGYLDRTDLLLIASVIGDPNSKFFFSKDHKLLESLILPKYCKSGFEICDGVKRNTTLYIKNGIDWLYE